MKQNRQRGLPRLAPVLALMLGGCTTAGNVVALSGPAADRPLPKMELLGRGFGGGPFRVTMPDGEVLNGRYVAPSGGGGVGVGTAVVGGQVITTTTVVGGSSGSFAAQAIGPQTSIVCQGGWCGMSASLLPGVVATCETSRNARYQVMF